MESSESASQQNNGKDQALRQKQLQTGELVITDFADFHFPYLFDPLFLNSANHETINTVGIPRILREELERTIADLQIKRRLMVTTQVSADKIRIIPEHGTGGWIDSPTVIQLYIDPTNPNILKNLADKFQRLVRHEGMHAAERQNLVAEPTLGRVLVSEGKATYYEERFAPRLGRTPWGHALTRGQLRQEMEKAKPELYLHDYSKNKHNEWFFNIKGEQHPRWTGYALGLAIVDGYKKRHPRLKMHELVRVPYQEVLSDTNFPRSLDSLLGFLPRR